MSGAMRIEKRGEKEWVMGAPDRLTDCGEVSPDGWECHYHLDGEHIYTSILDVDQDGAELVVARWPIDPDACAVAASPGAANEVAREMVPDPRQDDGERAWRTMIQDAEDYVPLEVQDTYQCASVLVADARGIVDRLYKRGFADGAATALAAQQPRDLADRIRALTLDWTDRLTGESTDVHDVFALEMVLRFYQTARRVAEWQSPAAAIEKVVANMRDRARPGAGHVHRMLDKAADELEGVVREYEKETA